MLRHLVLTSIGLILTILGSGRCLAQTLDDTGMWFAAFGSGKIRPMETESPFRWWFDSQLRLADDTDGFQQSILRPGVGYDVVENQTVWAGYAWIRTSPVLGQDFDEHRSWQQWTASPGVGDWKLLHRSRLEQRWVETGDDVGHRWRQMHRIQRTLTRAPQWSLIGWDEAFMQFNDTDWGAKGGFDQNRAFLGVGFKRSPDSRVRTEIGYLNLFLNRQGAEDRMNHILSFNLFY